MMFDDYILYHLEQMCCSEDSDEILAEIKGTSKVSSLISEMILPSKRNIEPSAGDSGDTPLDLGQHSGQSRQQIDGKSVSLTSLCYRVCNSVTE